MTATFAPPNLAGGTVINVQLLRYNGTPFCDSDGTPIEFACTGDDLADRLLALAESGWVHERVDAVNYSQHAELLANGTKFGVSVYHGLQVTSESVDVLAANRQMMVAQLAENVARAARP